MLLLELQLGGKEYAVDEGSTYASICDLLHLASTLGCRISRAGCEDEVDPIVILKTDSSAEVMGSVVVTLRGGEDSCSRPPWFLTHNHSGVKLQVTGLCNLPPEYLSFS